MALAVLTLDALTGFRLGLVRLGLSGSMGLTLVDLTLLALAMVALVCPGGLGHGGLGVPRWPCWSCALA